MDLNLAGDVAVVPERLALGARVSRHASEQALHADRQNQVLALEHAQAHHGLLEFHGRSPAGEERAVGNAEQAGRDCRVSLDQPGEFGKVAVRGVGEGHGTLGGIRQSRHVANKGENFLLQTRSP